MRTKILNQSGGQSLKKNHGPRTGLSWEWTKKPVALKKSVKVKESEKNPCGRKSKADSAV
jgi:hypothetical protein